MVSVHSGGALHTVQHTVQQAWVGPQRLVELDTDHLYRHLTEVNGKDTRGGYIDGKLEFADSILQSPFGLKISLVSDENPRTASSLRLHPNLLYMTRFEGTKRKRDLEAATPLWRIDLEIKDGEVYWWTESDAQPLFAQRLGVQLQPNSSTGLRNILDLKDLHLTVITPLVRTNVHGIRVKDSLGMRKPLFEHLEDHEWEDKIESLTKFYTNKENKSEMDKICLQFALHRMIPEEDNKEELEPMCPVLYSSPICNSKSRSLGILELIPDMVSSQKACCRNSRTIFLLSKFPLPGGIKPEREAFPRFVTKKADSEFCVDPRLQQPQDVSIVAGRVVIFRTPQQREEAVEAIYREGRKIYVDVYRQKDKQSSNVKIEFEFKIHTHTLLLGDDFDWCSICVEDPDRIGGRTMEESLQQRLSETGTARPGVKRRRRDNITGVGGTYPQVDQADNPLPENLFEGIHGADFNIVAEQLENEDFDLEEFLTTNSNPAMPDVLRGVIGRDGSMESVPGPGAPQNSQSVLASQHALESHPASPRSTEGLQGSPETPECISRSGSPGSLPTRHFEESVEYCNRVQAYFLDDFDLEVDTKEYYSDEEEKYVGHTGHMIESASVASSDLVDISPVPSSDGMREVRNGEVSVDGRPSSSSSNSSLERIKTRHERLPKSPSRCHEVALQRGRRETQEEEEVEGKEENLVKPIDLISRINNIGNSDWNTGAVDCVGDNYETSDQSSDVDIKPKVLEMTKKFGGARFGGAKKKIEQIYRSRPNLPKVRPKTRGLEENHARTHGLETHTQDTRQECLPVVTFLLTPVLVCLLAWLVYTWWTKKENYLQAGTSVEE